MLWDEIRFDEAVDLGFVPERVSAAEQQPAGDIVLTEVGVEAGLGESIAGGNPHGVGVGFFDATGDGREDIFLVGGSEHGSALYENDGDGTFSDITAASGIGQILGGVDAYSIAAADYESDGDFDVYVGAHPRDRLLQNAGDGTFTDVTDAAGAGGPASEQPGSASKIGAWGDYNGDGLMDIAVASSTFIDQPANGYLLRNNGDGTFTDVTAETGFAISPTGNPCAVMWSDFDNDGDQDLWVWNDRGDPTRNRTLLRNEGGAFTDITDDARVTQTVHGNPMGIDGADIDHDGYLDYYISDIGGSALLHNNGDGTFTDLVGYANADGTYGWGLAFEDFNADSWVDIFVAQEDHRDYLTFTNLASDPPSFSEQAWPHADVGNGHNVAAAFADYDDDGDVDVVTAGTGGARMNLFRNDTDRGTNRWLEVWVASTPQTGARGGISGRVVVATGEVIQFRDLTGGSSRASQNAVSVRFGLGQWTGADWVAVLWPDGRQLVVTGVEGNQSLDLSSAYANGT